MISDGLLRVKLADKNVDFDRLLVGWLMRFNLPLSTVIGYIGEDGDDMRMIGHEMRESPERHLPTLFERTGEIC